MSLYLSTSVAKTEPKDVVYVVFSTTENLHFDWSKLGSWSLKSNISISSVANQKKKGRKGKKKTMHETSVAVVILEGVKQPTVTRNK